MEKILSIIVPSYNMEKYLPKCLGSLVVAPELMERLEVLVVNDGSKDRTSEIAHEFAAKWPQTFKVIDKPNGHYGSCINAALPVATGKYVKVLDADDYFDTAVLAEYLAFLGSFDEKDSPDVIFSEYRFVDENGKIGSNWASCREMGLPEGRVFPMNDLRDKQAVCQHHAITYRTAILQKMGYRQSEGICYTDNEWSSIPMSAMKTAAYFPKILYLYLLGREGQSMQTAVWEKNLWMMEKGAWKIRQFVKDNEECADYDLAYPRQFAYSMFKAVYTTYIFSSNKSRIGLDIGAFDKRLAQEDPDIYRRLADEVYSRRIRYRYIRAWRRHAPLLGLCIAGCKLYSKVAPRLYAWYRCEGGVG